MIIFIVGILLIVYGVVSKKFSVVMGMLFVFLIMGFQEGLHTDYEGYKYTFEHGGAFVGGLDNTTKESEFTYLLLSNACSNIMSFHCFVLLTSLIQSAIMGIMIKDYSSKMYQYFGVFLVFFTFNIMLIQITAMRQAYAVDAFLLAFYLLGKRKFLWSILVSILAVGFHNSSIVFIPVYIFILLIMSFKKNKYEGSKGNIIVDKKRSLKTEFLVLSAFLLFSMMRFVLFDSYITPALQGLESFAYSDYLSVIESSSVAWWVILYHVLIVFLVSHYYVNERDTFKRCLALIVICSMFISIGTWGYGNLMRIGMYFIIFSIVVFPNVAAMLRSSYGKSVALGFVLFNMVYIMFFSVRNMLSQDYSDATGFYSYTFSFLDW